MVAAWLIATKGLEVDEAIEFLRSKRPAVSPNELRLYSESIHHRARLVRSEPTLEHFPAQPAVPRRAMRRALNRHRSFTPATPVASLPSLQPHTRISATEPRATPARTRTASKSWDEAAMDRSSSSSSSEEEGDADLAMALGGGRTLAAAETTVPAQLLYREFSTRRGSRTMSGRRLSAPPGQLAQSFGGTSSTEIVLLNRRDSPPDTNGERKKSGEERDANLQSALAGVEEMSFSAPKVGARKAGRKGLTKASLGVVRRQLRFNFSHERLQEDPMEGWTEM